jgi:hypothetical protein
VRTNKPSGEQYAQIARQKKRRRRAASHTHIIHHPPPHLQPGFQSNFMGNLRAIYGNLRGDFSSILWGFVEAWGGVARFGINLR